MLLQQHQLLTQEETLVVDLEGDLVVLVEGLLAKEEDLSVKEEDHLVKEGDLSVKVLVSQGSANQGSANQDLVNQDLDNQVLAKQDSVRQEERPPADTGAKLRKVKTIAARTMPRLPRTPSPPRSPNKASAQFPELSALSEEVSVAHPNPVPLTAAALVRTGVATTGVWASMSASSPYLTRVNVSSSAVIYIIILRLISLHTVSIPV